MESMNNWLAFSLSHQELPPPQPHQSSGLISGDDVSAVDTYGLSADTPPGPPLGIPTLRPVGSFGILEAFNRTNQHPQDHWNMKGMEFKGSSSELSMLIGSSSNVQNAIDDDEPKLEDFLGGNSFGDHDHQKLPPGCNYMYSNSCSLQPAATMASNPSNGSYHMSSDNGGPNHNSIGLSMIKTWLRNNPVPPQQLDSKSNEAAARTTATTGTGTTNCSSTGLVASSQSLSLSMSTGGSQSSSPLPLMAAAVGGGGGGGGGGECSSSSENKQKGGRDAQSGGPIESVPRKSMDTFGQRTSIYRGVTRHRWTGRYEAHLWDNSCRREGQTRKGRQVYLGGYDKEEKAARAYDLAALKYWGTTTTTNFPISNYEKELEEMKHMTRQEYVASLRRKSSGFSRGASIYRGVTRHHQHGRWQARIGRVAGNKDLYLGTFSTQEEAAEAYDIAAIKFRGLNAVTNFDMSRYDVKSIMESSTLPIGGAAKRLKEATEHSEASVDGRRTGDDHITSQLTDGISSYGSQYGHGWPTIAFQHPQPALSSFYHPYAPPQRGWCKPEHDVITAAHSLQDLHQLQLGSGTHNFFQPSSAIHNLMTVDSPMEHSTGSNSVIYGGSIGGSSGSYQGVVGGGGSSNGYMMPIGTVVVDQSHNNHQASNSFVGGDDEAGKQYCAYEADNMIATSDPCAARSLYYMSQQPLPTSVVKANGYEQTSWIPASAQAIAARPNNMGGCHGSLFSAWNDA